MKTWGGGEDIGKRRWLKEKELRQSQERRLVIVCKCKQTTGLPHWQFSHTATCLSLATWSSTMLSTHAAQLAATAAEPVSELTEGDPTPVKWKHSQQPKNPTTITPITTDSSGVDAPTPWSSPRQLLKWKLISRQIYPLSLHHPIQVAWAHLITLMMMVKHLHQNVLNKPLKPLIVTCFQIIHVTYIWVNWTCLMPNTPLLKFKQL